MYVFPPSESIYMLRTECLNSIQFETISICTLRSKITKILNSEENQFGKSIITWQNQIIKRIKNEWTTELSYS